jgi:hypothetical protein
MYKIKIMNSRIVVVPAANLVALQNFAQTGHLRGWTSLGINLRDQIKIVEEVTGQPVPGTATISQFRQRAEQAVTWLRALHLPGVKRYLANPTLGMVQGKMVEITI